MADSTTAPDGRVVPITYRTPILKLTAPNPDGSDDLGDWPVLDAQGLIDLENALNIAEDSKDASGASTTWPAGVSVMGVTPNGTGGWPTGNGLVLTLRRAADALTMQFHLVGAVGSQPTVRMRVGSGAGWGDWYLVSAAGLPTAMATGQITLTPPAGGGTVVGTVLFPANRFTSPPRIALSAITGNPENVRYSLNATPTASQMQVALNRNDGAFGTSIQWTATGGVDS